MFRTPLRGRSLSQPKFFEISLPSSFQFFSIYPKCAFFCKTHYRRLTSNYWIPLVPKSKVMYPLSRGNLWSRFAKKPPVYALFMLECNPESSKLKTTLYRLGYWLLYRNTLSINHNFTIYSISMFYLYLAFTVPLTAHLVLLISLDPMPHMHKHVIQE